MKWEGPICECGHPLDLHWPVGISDAVGRSCRARGCACGGQRPKGEAQAPPPEAARTAPTARREKDWQQAVIDLGTLTGWLIYHTHDSRRSQPGFPDLVLVRGGQVLFRELKRNGNTPTLDQRRWISALQGAGQDAAVWTFPDDWPVVVETLQ